MREEREREKWGQLELVLRPILAFRRRRRRRGRRGRKEGEK